MCVAQKNSTHMPMHTFIAREFITLSSYPPPMCCA